MANYDIENIPIMILVQYNSIWGKHRLVSDVGLGLRLHLNLPSVYLGAEFFDPIIEFKIILAIVSEIFVVKH